MEINKFLSKWEQILHKLNSNNGKVFPIEIGKRATAQEITAKEKELGYQLPPSYKHILLNLGKSLSFYYSFSNDTMIPSEFKEIFSGEINWNIDFLQNLDTLADELMEDGEDYGKTLRGKLEFAHAGNGDVYAFDMSVEGEEKPVIYWDHEDDSVTYIADSFIDYLFRITELACIGSEKWQLEYFLSDTGLVTTSSAAIKWKNWFNSFSETMLDDVKNDMEQLVAFVVYRKKLDEKEINYLQKFNRKVLFDFLLKELHKKEVLNNQRIICEIIGRVLGDYVETWVKSLWEDKKTVIDTRLRSCLTSMCMSKDEGLSLVFNFLEQVSNKQISGYEALSHLGDFHSRDVISWMEGHVKFPVTEGWDELFFRSNFSWEELERWTMLEEKHEVTVIHALEKYVHDTVSNNKHPHDILTIPTKLEFIDFLVNLRGKQVLKRRVMPIENVIQNINIFY
ncbi:SMI1/KNR4 family protein [Chengkuizengella sediminis]|uniref:SMI1/KNR4 family protein n=1 Tax=Chengkuizengella sediminis TaxID=1885917 RepID=UPI00138986A3|nr:SMI1/KNR4 family protein [Chengkuizengella sediminis]NDI35770.1 SMI1/KNR4 family protein [Chengkuizengella sediminis]